MDTMSDTPETDAMEYFDAICDPDRIVEADFCRKLERERDDARNALIIAVDEMVQVQSQLRDVERERDTYSDQADSLVDRLGATQERMIDAERERDEARKDSIFWQSLAEGRGRTNDDCSVCGGCFMIPGTEPNDDVMNTPCPKCNSQHYTPLPADPRHASFVQTKQ